MAIDKSLYTAPEGIDEAPDENWGEMEVVLEEDAMLPDTALTIVELADGSVEIDMGDGDEDRPDLSQALFDDNLADYMRDSDLAALGSELLALVEEDKRSRDEWVEIFAEGLDVLGFKYEDVSRPWDDACGVHSTVLAEAVIRFQAETMSETFPAAGPVKTKVIGKETREKLEAARRVRADMNYQLTEKMPEYRPEHERMLFTLGLCGSAFKKVYFDPTLGRQTATYVPAEDVIVPYGESTIELAERATHVLRKTPNQIKKLQAMGFYREVDLPEPTPYTSDIEDKKAEDEGYNRMDDNRHALYEIHADMLIEGIDDEDGIAKPFVITIDESSGEVLGLRRNWREEDPLWLKRQHFVHYCYIPGFGFYGLGLIHVIGGYARAGTSLIRQLVDAGTLANLPGGFKTRGMRVKGDDQPHEPGEWRDVDVPSGTLKDNLMPLPYGEPSQTLFALLERITEEGRRLGAIGDMNVSDMSANMPVGTTLALLERTLKPMAAVQSRVHYALAQELKLLKAIIADHSSEVYDYLPEKGDVSARRADYDMVDVIPVSDPNSSTMAQRVVQYQAAVDMASKAPQIYDLPELHRQTLEVLGIKNAEKIIPLGEDAIPQDPVSENMAALVGKPTKAFIYQDHEAHIATHQAFMQDPMIAQGIGQNPQANQIMGSLQAHIAEHMGFLYRKQIEDKLGVSLPPPGSELPEEIEVNLARLMADAGRQVTQAKQQEAAAQQAQQQAQDPIMQLKKQDADTKAQKAAADAQLAQRKQAHQEFMDKEELKIDQGELMLKAKQANSKPPEGVQ